MDDKYYEELRIKGTLDNLISAYEKYLDTVYPKDVKSLGFEEDVKRLINAILAKKIITS